jgi:hypothetical protein
MPGIRGILLAAAMGSSALTGAACFVEDVPSTEYVDEGYAPMYYDGYVVYYDNVGRPYYYSGGAVYWVPPESPLYVPLVNHWRTYGPEYRHWYAYYGYRYRVYRYRRP